MEKHKSGCSWRVLLITVIVIASTVFIINRISWANLYKECRERAAEHIAEGNYASALMIIQSNSDAFKDGALKDECIEKLPEQGAAIASGKDFIKSSEMNRHWSIANIRELYLEYGGDDSVFDKIEQDRYISEAEEYIKKGDPGNAARELLKLPEEEAYATQRAFAQACEVLAHQMYVAYGKDFGSFGGAANNLEKISDIIPDAGQFAAALRSLEIGDIETAWVQAGEIVFDGTQDHPILIHRENIFRYALNGGMKNIALTPGMLKMARELFKPTEGQSLSSFLNYCYKNRSSLKVTNLDDAGKSSAGKVLILGYGNTVQLEVMRLLDDRYYPESIEEVGIILSCQSGFSRVGYYGSRTYAEAKREYFKICIENTELGTKEEKVLWADPVPGSIPEGQNGYTSTLDDDAKIKFVYDYIKKYSWMK